MQRRAHRLPPRSKLSKGTALEVTAPDGHVCDEGMVRVASMYDKGRPDRLLSAEVPLDALLDPGLRLLPERPHHGQLVIADLASAFPIEALLSADVQIINTGEARERA